MLHRETSCTSGLIPVLNSKALLKSPIPPAEQQLLRFDGPTTPVVELDDTQPALIQYRPLVTNQVEFTARIPLKYTGNSVPVGLFTEDYQVDVMSTAYVNPALSLDIHGNVLIPVLSHPELPFQFGSLSFASGTVYLKTDTLTGPILSPVATAVASWTATTGPTAVPPAIPILNERLRVFITWPNGLTPAAGDTYLIKFSGVY